MNRGERYAALQRGDSTYNGGPCPKCGGTLRYTKAASCVSCTHKRNAARRRKVYAEDPATYLAKHRAYRAKNPDRVRQWARASAVRRQYGLELVEVEAMRLRQGETCAICYEYLDPSKMHIDHCHETGKVRGLLCQQCNHGLGNLRDSPELARRASLYLQGNNEYA